VMPGGVEVTYDRIIQERVYGWDLLQGIWMIILCTYASSERERKWWVKTSGLATTANAKHRTCKSKGEKKRKRSGRQCIQLAPPKKATTKAHLRKPRHQARREKLMINSSEYDTLFSAVTMDIQVAKGACV